MDTILGSVTSDLLSKAMDVCYETHKVIANNIANIDTHSYIPMKVDFESVFENVKRDIEGADASGLRESIAEIDVGNLPSAKSNGDWVGLEESMVQLTQNTLRYHALTDMRSGLGAIYSSAIQGGKR